MVINTIQTRSRGFVIRAYKESQNNINLLSLHQYLRDPVN